MRDCLQPPRCTSNEACLLAISQRLATKALARVAQVQRRRLAPLLVLASAAEGLLLHGPLPHRAAVRPVVGRIVDRGRVGIVRPECTSRCACDA